MPSSLAEAVDRARELLRRSGRLSLRLLHRELGLDDDALDLVVEELTDVHRVALREGDVLAWRDHPHASERGDSPAGEPSRDAERRQLTVLFCDLVESTRLASGMDMEDWRAVVQGYHAAAAEVIARFEGHVAQYLGDGVVAYFGWPQAHEDDAERAVRAGLGILHALAERNEAAKSDGSVRLVARVGIHTGPVVVGWMHSGARSETLALGETTNVAARIQVEASPGTLLISGATLALVRGIFVTGEAERRSLKGIAEPVALHRVIQPAGVRSRLAAPGAQLSRFVGREQELGLLLERWRQAAEGRGQTVLLSGDAGVGKSRLALVLRERLGDQPHTWLECRSTPYTRGTALFPVIELVQQGLAFAAGDSPETRLRKIENGLALAPLDARAIAPFVADLLGVPHSDAHPRLELSPELERQRTFEALTTWALALAEIQPVLLLVEDLHWCDPSSLELFGRLVQQLPASRVLLVLTTRPDFAPPWEPPPKSWTPIALTRLDRPSSRELVRSLASNALPEAAVTQILARADGVPLYLEELTRAALESGALGAPVAIPATLQDSLMARLDRLSAARAVAQLASVLGREFPYRLLAAVTELDESALRQTLARLVEAGLLFQHGTLPEAVFTFRHTLLQEAAYGSLLRRRRQEIHERTARLLERRFAERVAAEPEVVARHYRAAGRAEPAARYFERAAARAVRASAHAEAVGHLREAAELLGQCAESKERAARELAVQTALGASLAQTRGFSSEETQAAWQRAHDLLETVPDSDRLAETLFGIANFEHTRGHLRAAAASAERLGRLAGSPLLGPVSAYLLGVTDYYLGRPRRAAAHLERAANALEGAGEELSERFGADVCIGTQAFLGWALWMIGEADRAVVVADASIARARASRELPSLGFALAFAATLHKMRRDRERARALAGEAGELAERHGYPVWLAVAQLVDGWCAIGQGPALAQILSGMSNAGSTGNQGAVPHILSILAEAQREAGLRDQALATLDGALALSARFEMAFWDSELHRSKGELLLEMPGADPAAAEGELRLAVEIASRQEAKFFELRAATRLARRWRDCGKTSDALAVLRGTYTGFTEGFDTADLIEAKRLLDELV